MTNEERDRMLIETHTDVKWIKEQHKLHIEQHAKYMYYLVITAIGALIGIFR